MRLLSLLAFLVSAVVLANAAPVWACAPLAVDFASPTVEGLASGEWEQSAASEFAERAVADGWTDAPELQLTGVSHVRWAASTPDKEGWFRAGVRTTVQTWGESPAGVGERPVVRDDGPIQDAEVIGCGELGWDAPPAETELLHVGTNTGITKVIRVSGADLAMLSTGLESRFGSATSIPEVPADEIEALLVDSIERRGLGHESWAPTGPAIWALAAVLVALLGAAALSRTRRPRAGAS